VKRYLAFLLIGSFFATVEEFLTVVVLRHDVASYVFTLLILFPVFLTLVYFSSRLIDRSIARQPTRHVVHFLSYGWMGLMIEWFLIGLTPWKDPDANPILVLLFQLGMFSFWSTVAFAPRLLLDTNPWSRRHGQRVLWFYVPYFVFVYTVAWLTPETLRFVALIGLIIFGYLTVNALFVLYFFESFAQTAAAEGEDQQRMP
jgi:hypothetical protein